MPLHGPASRRSERKGVRLRSSKINLLLLLCAVAVISTLATLADITTVGSPSIVKPRFGGNVPPARKYLSLRKCGRPTQAREEFVNEGDFQFMKDAIKTQFTPGSGKKITWGVLTDEVTGPLPSEAEQSRLRAVAAEKLVNIDADERTRRRTVGQLAYIFTFVLGTAMIFYPVPAVARLGLFVPLSLAQGFTASADKGL